MTTIVPYLAVSDGRAAVEFYTNVFGATIDESEYFEMDDGRLGHATMAIGEARIFLSDEFPELGAHAPTSLGGSSVAVVIYVDDTDETMAAAEQAGATIDRPAKNERGERSGWFVDPWGHRWSAIGPEA